ncbi:MAG TPA: hypothetical protein VN850_13630 [Candidatus Acidoferrales bacterium]|jgi:hypothetical protein|nr:hypothetical protein [Candidatus Acidoferrales bacterium]
MMAALIFIFSFAALMQFFVSYCRSLIAASARRALSADVQDVIGIKRSASGDDFARVMQFLYLCPDRREDRNGIKAIGAYFRLLGAVGTTMGRLIPSLRAWTESERSQCAYFAAVALDRRIAHNRDMFAEQMSA